MHRSLLSRGVALAFALAVSVLIVPAVAHAYGYYCPNMWGACGHVAGLFDLPTGIDVDDDGNVYVCDRNSERIQKFTNGGQFIREWSVPGLSPSPTPFAICVDGDYVYVADGANSCILKYTLDGDFVLQWGSFGSGNGEFYDPIGLATGPDHSVYVSDLENNRIQKFTSEGVYVTQWSEITGGTYMFHPRGLCTDPAGNVYVAMGSRVYEFTSAGAYVDQFGGGTLSGAAVDVDRGPNGDFYVTDQFFHSVIRFAPYGTVGMGSFGSDFGQMRYPTGAAVDADGKVFVADYQNCRVVVFDECLDMTITDQPDALALPYGATATFHVTATNGYFYAWLKDNRFLDDNERISGTQTSTLTISDFQESDLGDYTCIVQNICRQGTTTDPAALTHSDAPSCFGPAATPPNGMAAWWAMDPGPGNTTPDVLHPVGNKNHASLTGAASLVAGKVGTAVRCDGIDDGLHVPSTLSPRLAANSSGLSIDAWILPRSGSPANANRMILQKGLGKKQSASAGGVTGLAPGYAFYLHNGQLGFQMPDPNYNPMNFEPAMTPMTMDEWHHVAVTVDPLVVNGGKFYVDGVVVATFTPPSKAIGNLADLYVGRFTPQWGPEFPASAFNGDIDEVEIFITAIDAASVQGIFAAGCTGKRRVQVLTNSLASIREATSSADVCFEVQNLSSIAHSYNWSFAAAAPATGCPSSVPVTFTAASGSVTVPAGQTVDLSTVASVSPLALSTPFTRCYTLTVTDLADNGVMTASGQITWAGQKIAAKATCTLPEVGAPSLGAAPFGTTLAATGTATFTLFNDGPFGMSVPVSVRTRDPETGLPSTLLRVQGLAAGATWTGSVFVPASGSAPLPVSVALDEYEPFLAHEIVLAADPDGNSTYDDLASTRVAASDDTSLAFVSVGPGSTSSAPTLALHAAPNPFGPGTALLFTLAQSTPVEVDVLDVSGRRVRRVLSGRLEAGEQRIAWDGHDDAGTRLPAGVYLGRVRVGKVVSTVRLLRLR